MALFRVVFDDGATETVEFDGTLAQLAAQMVANGHLELESMILSSGQQPTRARPIAILTSHVTRMWEMPQTHPR
jgi:hypothetical protein